MSLQRITNSFKSLLPSFLFTNPKTSSQTLSYNPTFFLRHHFLQSMYELTSPQINIIFQRQKIYFDDGGHISLDWCNREKAQSGHPIILIMHGMTGGSETKYIKVLVEKANENQYCSVCLNSRGINSEMTSPIPFTGIQFHEIDKAIDRIRIDYPSNPLYLVGTSLGGNYILRYMISHTNQKVEGMVLISPPFDLKYVIDGGMNMTYQKFFIKSYLQNTILRHEQMKFWWETGLVDLESLKSSKNLMEFHERITTKILGFENSTEMFEQFRVKEQQIQKFPIKTLIMTSKDDPMVGFQSFPIEAITKNKNIKLMTTDHGGHLCWFQGIVPKRWYPKPTFDFIKQIQSQRKSKLLN